MKTGLSLQQIAAELERQVESRRDVIATQNAINAAPIEGDVVLEIGKDAEPMRVTNHAHGQLSSHLSIPKAYYDRMRSTHPELLAQNINTWLRDDAREQRMLRTIDGRVRAILSPRYRPLDNLELANAVLPTLLSKGVQIMSADLTETRLYIKGILPELSEILPYGMERDTELARAGRVFGGPSMGGDGKVVAAITISNSEVGAGSLRIEPSVFTTFCRNMAILKAAMMKKYHVGRAFDLEAETMEVYSDATRQADDRAFFMKVRDVTIAAFSDEGWQAAIASIRQATQTPIESDDLPKVVEVAVQRLALPTGAAPTILKHLAGGGDLSQWGLSSAITSAANDREDYEEATEFEHAGGKVLALPARDWQAIARAKAA